MASSSATPAVPPPNRPSRPFSEALLNEKVRTVPTVDFASTKQQIADVHCSGTTASALS
jgi:hypothetical protein